MNLASINKIAGRDVDVTVRYQNAFTFSFDEIDRTATKKLTDFFRGQGELTIDEDAECGTCIYFEIQ